MTAGIQRKAKQEAFCSIYFPYTIKTALFTGCKCLGCYSL